MAEAREPRSIEIHKVVEKLKVRAGQGYQDHLLQLALQDAMQDDLTEENEALTQELEVYKRRVADLELELATLRGDSQEPSSS